MIYLQLSPQTGFGLIGDRPIFLDLKRDRYFTLAVPAAAAFEQLRHADGALPPDHPGLTGLLETGLFTAAASPQCLLPASASASARGLSDRLVRAGLFDLAEASLLLFGTRRALARRRLARIVASITVHKADHAAGRGARCSEAAARRFLAARTLVPVSPSCLLDSLALRRWLNRRAARASLIFGVKLDPFAAHCWLQADDVVLNDAPDRIAEFTPVLVVS